MVDMGVLCGASEKGKIVVNRCLDKGYYINTWKLEKLLIIIHGIMLSKYGKPFFTEKITAEEHGLMIPQVDSDFIINAIAFKEKVIEYISLLEKEEETLNYVVDTYGKLDAFEIENQRKEFKVLKDICSNQNIDTMNKPNKEIPNALIETVFDYYKFYDFNIVKQNESSFQKKLKNKII